MFFLLVRSSQQWLEAHNLGFLRVFTFVTFQATVSVVLSFLFCIFLGPSVISWLRRHKVGDQAKFDHADMDDLWLEVETIADRCFGRHVDVESAIAATFGVSIHDDRVHAVIGLLHDEEIAQLHAAFALGAAMACREAEARQGICRDLARLEGPTNG